MPQTNFAPTAKAVRRTPESDIDLVISHPIIDGLLQSVNGMLAVLNEHRQIISVNDSFLKTLGYAHLLDLLSLRLGEAVHCIHAAESPNGCGTTKARYCASCGTAIAIVTCLDKNMPAERTCALTVKRKGKTVEICLSVRAQPLTIEGKRYILLFLQDITKEQFLLSLERTFFHEINNILCGLLGSCQLYGLQHDNPPEIQKITNLALLLCQEVEVQRNLSRFGDTGLKSLRQKIGSEEIINEIKEIFANHPLARHKTIHTANLAPGQTIDSDITLLIRVLCNMVTNALEATKDRGEIKLWIDEYPGGLAIKVWNREVIPAEVGAKIFQRYFTTKEGPDRGFGTYSMKIFGEQYLGGKVAFTSTVEDGTTFCLTL